MSADPNHVAYWGEDWVHVNVGKQRLDLADIEVADDGAIAHIHHWHDISLVGHGTTLLIPCRDRAEAAAVVEALLRIRGIGMRLKDSPPKAGSVPPSGA